MPEARKCFGDVEVRELRDSGAHVGHDHSDPPEPSVRDCAERYPAAVDVVLEPKVLYDDGLLAVSVCVPGRRTPLPGPLHELGAALLVDEVDALGAVDLDDAS